MQNHDECGCFVFIARRGALLHVHAAHGIRHEDLESRRQRDHGRIRDHRMIPHDRSQDRGRCDRRDDVREHPPHTRHFPVRSATQVMCSMGSVSIATNHRSGRGLISISKASLRHSKVCDQCPAVALRSTITSLQRVYTVCHVCILSLYVLRSSTSMCVPPPSLSLSLSVCVCVSHSLCLFSFSRERQ